MIDLLIPTTEYYESVADKVQYGADAKIYGSIEWEDTKEYKNSIVF